MNNKYYLVCSITHGLVRPVAVFPTATAAGEFVGRRATMAAGDSAADPADNALTVFPVDYCPEA